MHAPVDFQRIRVARATLVVSLLCCLGCAGTAPEPAPLPVAAPAPAAAHTPAAPFAAFIPDDHGSRLYIDFARARQVPALATATEVLRQYVATRRPDVAPFFASEALAPERVAGQALLSARAGSWTWAMTVRYPRDDETTREALSVLPRGPGRAVADVGIAPIEGYADPVWIGAPRPGHLLLATADAIDGALAAGPTRISFADPNDILALEASWPRALWRVGIDPGSPVHARVFADGDRVAVRIRVDTSSPSIAEDAAETARANLARRAGTLLARLSGLAPALAAARVETTGPTVRIAMNFDARQCATVALAAFTAMRHPPGMPDPTDSTGTTDTGGS